MMRLATLVIATVYAGLAMAQPAMPPAPGMQPPMSPMPASPSTPPMPMPGMPSPNAAPNPAMAPQPTKPAAAAPTAQQQGILSVGSGKYKIGYDGRAKEVYLKKPEPKEDGVPVAPMDDAMIPSSDPVYGGSPSMYPYAPPPAPEKKAEPKKLRSDSGMRSDAAIIKPKETAAPATPVAQPVPQPPSPNLPQVPGSF